MTNTYTTCRCQDCDREYFINDSDTKRRVEDKCHICGGRIIVSESDKIYDYTI